LPVLAKHMGPRMGAILEEYRDNPKRYDAFVRAQRVHDLLASLAPISEAQEATIPPKSLMREYIGGSDYEY